MEILLMKADVFIYLLKIQELFSVLSI